MLLRPLIRWGLLLFSISATRLLAGADLPIIPIPTTVVREPGSFTLNSRTGIIVHHQTANLADVAKSLAEKLRRATGFPLNVRPDHRTGATENTILLTNEVHGEPLGDEGYELTVTEHSITIAAPTAHGVFYGVQTLYQLMPPQVETPFAASSSSSGASGNGSAAPVSSVTTSPAWDIPCAFVRDIPRFSWRSMHLDVGRHFFHVGFVKKYIDLLAAYKFNTFHWHLTEDQGWRIEIKKYPLLAKVGSQRRETMGDCIPYGGYYTQDEIRDVVEYAKQRFITIVPEIEMPGHSQAALAAYPEFSCSGGPLKVATEWGVFNDVYCAGREETFRFLQDVLDEVTKLFPGPFVHVGGDECPKVRWKNCVRCQDRIRSERLKDEGELQSYFIKRIEKILQSKQKRLIGWDEILEGGLPPNATVMSWRGTDGGIAAARAGHDVVMSPGTHCYFDHLQGKTGEPAGIGGYLPIDTVYSYEPVPAALTPEEGKHILGAQGNMWTEWMPTADHVEYMLLPRMLALSEVLWSPRAARNYADFTRRLETHYDRFVRMGVNYRVPPPAGAGGRVLAFHDTIMTLTTPVSKGKVYFSIGAQDSIPNQLYEVPIPIRGENVVFAQTELSNGRKSPIIKTEFLPVDRERNGIDYRYYQGKWDSLPDFSRLNPVRSGIVYDISLDGIQHREDEFGVRLSGSISIGTEGEYEWFLSSDDGSKLFIDNKLVVNNDGLHGTNEKSAPLHLSSGKHPITILYFERDGDQYLDLAMQGPGIPKHHVPPGILSR